MSDRAPRSRSIRSIAMSVTGWLLVCTGAGHGLLVVGGLFAKPSAQQQVVRDAMVGTSMDMAGLERNYWQLFQGFSLLMALMLIGYGVLLVLVTRAHSPALPVSRAVTVLTAAIIAPALLISVLLLPLPPIVLLSLALAATALALASGSSRRTTDDISRVGSRSKSPELI